MTEKKKGKFEDFKEFFQTHRKKFLYAGIAFFVFVLLFAALGLTLKLNFLLGDEIILHLLPKETSLQMHYGDMSEVTFSLYATNFPACTASCAYTFNDKSQNRMIENRSFTLGRGELLEKSYNISISRIGRGQDVYSFDVSCKNEPSFLCLSTGLTYHASSPLVVNYDLSEEEKSAKEETRMNLTAFLQRLVGIDISLKKLNSRIQALSSIVLLTDVLDEKALLEGQFSELIIESERLRSLWNKESYLELRFSLNGSQEEGLHEIERLIAEENSLIDASVNAHNELIERMLIIQNQFDRDLEWSKESLANLDLMQKAAKARLSINETSSLFMGRMYTNYSVLEHSVAQTENAVIEFGDSIKRHLIENAIQTAFHVTKENDHACTLKGSICNVSGSMAKLHLAYQSQQSQEWWQLDSSQQRCEELEQLESELNSTQNSTRALLGDIFSNATDMNASATALEHSIRDALMQQYFAYLGSINDPRFLNITIPLINVQNVPTVQDNLTLRQFLLMTLEPSEDTLTHKSQACSISSLLSVPIFSVPTGFPSALINVTEHSYEANSTIDATLSDNPPVCCVFGECTPCCTSDECAKDPATYPIIFLHGHAFTSGTSAAYSLDAFTSIQSSLEREGYLKAGIVTPQTKESALAGEWGLSGRPVTVKASYYFDAFREEDDYIIVPTKSENIDTYALRLRDIVSTVQEKTGKDEVVIVAHSMGGLVARRYMQVFGDADVHKLVMIGTPNKGVVGRVKDYCPIFGEQKECLDMQEGSLFLNKLNDPTKQPTTSKIYVIAGSGCRMEGEEGDGVVLYDHAIMQNANNFNVTGSCEGLFGEVLHTEMLNSDKYPQTVEILREILKE